MSTSKLLTIITGLINAFPGFVLLLDEDRRLVYSNRKMVFAALQKDVNIVAR